VEVDWNIDPIVVDTPVVRVAFSKIIPSFIVDETDVVIDLDIYSL